jgi:hypothetical protein
MTIRAFTTAILCAAAVSVPATAQMPPAPVRVTFECKRDPDVKFQFSVESISGEATTVLIGDIVGTKFVVRLELDIKRPGVADRTLTYGEAVPGIAGQIMAWLVPLPPNASYSMTVPAAHWQRLPSLSNDPFAGAAQLRLRLNSQIGSGNPNMPGVRVLNLWTGTLISDWLSFPDQCGPGR